MTHHVSHLPMLVGYNTNVPYKGTLYHVQTEDSGLKNPVIITLLYIKGTILASKKISYAHIASSPDYREKVRELMKEQHKTMMKELISGKHTGNEEPTPQEESAAKAEAPAAPAASEPPPAKPQEAVAEDTARSLDDILLDFIIHKGSQ